MNRRSACVIIGGICLIVGTGFGLCVARWLQPPVTMEPVSEQLNSVRGTIDNSSMRTASTAHASTDDVDDSQTELMSRRLEAIRWLKQSDVFVQVSMMDFLSSRINQRFSQLFELTLDEEARLQLAAQQAKERLASASAQVAVSETSSDGRQLVVKVPRMPETGGAILDQLLADVGVVLGPERMELFDVIAADGFDNSFEQFGLNEITYTVDLTPKPMSNGTLMIYRIETESIGPQGEKSAGANQVTVDHALKTFPVLRRFLPAEMLNEVKSP